MKRNSYAILLIVGTTFASGRSTAQEPPTTSPADADREAIVKSAKGFADAFNKGDAKAIAAMYTVNGEAREADGQIMIGRAEIENAYAEYFKASPGVSIEVMVKSVRFPAKDMGIEQGLLRLTRGPKGLPETTKYVVIHAREGGQWRMALSTETGSVEDQLEDLEWLLGDWTTQAPAGTIAFSFKRDPKKPVVTGTFTRTPPGKDPITGSIRIALNPETGKIHSWGFDENGGHSQAVWTCDGKSWILDINGVTAMGVNASQRILLQRVAPDAITWRGVDRTLGGASFPDTPPLRLTRVARTTASTK